MSADTDMVEQLDEVIDALKTGGWVKLNAGALSYLEPIRAALDASGIGELEAENERLRQQLEPYLKQEKAVSNARQRMRDELAAERAALSRARATVGNKDG